MKTRKLGLMIALVIFAFSSAKAQIPGFSLGIKAGYLYSTFPTSLSGVTSKNGRSGYQIGAFARIGGSTFIQPELNYEGQSGTVSFGSHTDPATGTVTASGTSTLKFNRLDIPVLLGHKFIALPLLNLRGYIGPDFGFKTSASNNRPNDFNANDYNFKSSTVGGIIGVGVDVGSITFDARYNLGFTQVNKGFDTRINSFGIGVGFKFL